MQSKYYKTTGEVEDVEPKNGKHFTYEELKKFVGYPVQIVPLPNGQELVCNDEGKITGLDANENATEIWKSLYPIKDYPLNNDELIVGNALICDADKLEGDEE